MAKKKKLIQWKKKKMMLKRIDNIPGGYSQQPRSSPPKRRTDFSLFFSNYSGIDFGIGFSLLWIHFFCCWILGVGSRFCFGDCHIMVFNLWKFGFWWELLALEGVILISVPQFVKISFSVLALSLGFHGKWLIFLFVVKDLDLFQLDYGGFT